MITAARFRAEASAAAAAAASASRPPRSRPPRALLARDLVRRSLTCACTSVAAFACARASDLRRLGARPSRFHFIRNTHRRTARRADTRHARLMTSSRSRECSRPHIRAPR